MAEKPSKRHGPRDEADGELRIFEPPRRKMEAGLKQRGIAPARLENRSFASAGRLHAAQGQDSAAAIVVHKPEVPATQKQAGGNRAQQPVDQDQSPHKTLYADGTTGNANWARAPGADLRFFLPEMPGGAGRYNVQAVTLLIRPSEAEDFETLWKMDQLCFPADQAYSRQELHLYMRRRGAFTLVAESAMADAKPVIAGFIVAEAGPRGSGHIVTIDVVSDARRAGVGSKLLEEAERRLLAAGCNVVVLETAVNNASALMFYKRHRYFVEKTVPRYYNNTLDALQMRKDLLPAASDG